MQSVMQALCRHVPKNGLQTDTNCLRVETCSWLFAQEALSLCSAVERRCRKTKMDLLSGRNLAREVRKNYKPIENVYPKRYISFWRLIAEGWWKKML